METLIVNSCFYWATSFYFLKKYGMSLLSFLWLYYSVFSVFGVLLMVDDLYFQLNGTEQEDMNPIPYVYMYITFFLITYPFRKVVNSTFVCPDILYNSKSILKVCNFLNLIAIIYVAVKVFQVFSVAQIGFGVMHANKDDSIIYPGVLGSIMRPINFVGRVNNMVIMPAVVFFVINGYVKRYFSGKYAFKMTIPYSAGVLLMGFVGGSRAAFFFGLMTLSFYYVLFYNTIPRKVHRLLWLLLILFLAVSFNVIIEITVYRFNIDAKDSILSYLGQMWPNANYEVWEHVIYFPMGERMFPSIFGKDYMDSDLWYYKMDFKGWLFVTLWGALYSEYGQYYSMVILIILYFIINAYFSKKKIYIYEVGIVSFIYFFAFSSLFNLAFTNADYIGLILAILFAIYLKLSQFGKLFRSQ